jgi:hypothetical protein
MRGKLSAADRLERLARITPRTASRLDAARAVKGEQPVMIRVTHTVHIPLSAKSGSWWSGG